MVRSAAAVAALTLALAGCGSSSSGSTPAAASGGDVQSALQAGGSLTVWAWEPTLKPVVTAFEAKYPKVKVNLVNAGTGNDQYKALQNAVAAGNGIPDVAQIEYYALPQFALGKSLADLSPLGAGSLNGTFTPGPWNAIHQGSGVYGLPMDSGPMALFYNKEVFDKYQIQVPTTWDQYVAAAQKLHAANPKAYIANDTGDAGFTTSLIWQARGKPFTVDGTNVKINFADTGSATFAATWQKLISGHLLAPVTSWSDGWYKGLGDGTIATLSLGAWMPANLVSGVPGGSGKWRVAPLPQWTAGGTASAENGGSSLAVMKASTRAALAYGFMKYATVDDGVQIRVDKGAFPATTAQLNSQAFLNTPFPYFGGQQANQVFAASAKSVVSGWSYLPFQVYANSIFNDTVGKAYVSGTTLAQGLASWQQACAKYGTDQGFTMG
ncbi:MAG TPA: sugar ABC transporter substrate-binding protein [Rugosimonospora sp.]|nr:sugar ABC transporter substrate-binding protein [Rugosimonospora sp.]